MSTVPKGSMNWLAHRSSDSTADPDDTEKVFIRETFAVLEIDQHSTESLNKLKSRFMACRKDLGGLDVDEFVVALRPLVCKGVSDAHIRTIFRKMDTSGQGAVSWDEFINFTVTEHSMRLLMFETMDEMPFGTDVHCIKHQHRDPIVCISFMPNVDVNDKTVDWNFGKYMVLSREGMMSIWSLSMKAISYNNLVVDTHKEQSWFLDMACLYHNGYIATVTSGRDLALYDYTQRGWMRKYHIRNLDNCACVMTYWAGLKSEQAIIVLGDSSGSIVMIEFDLSNLIPMFGFSVREGCYSFFWSDIHRGMCHGTTARVFSRVHNDWVKQVQYVPELQCNLSCCIDDDTAMYMTFRDNKKRDPLSFMVVKGVLCFDYSHVMNVLACGGIDGNIYLFNPYVPKKLVAALQAHIRPVVHLKVNETEKYTLSVDMGNTIIIINLVNQMVLQRIPGQSVHTGNHAINTVYLHCKRRVCLLGSTGMAMIRRHRLEDNIEVDVRSHDFKIVGALYSHEFEQVVSVCRGSMVRVWDLNTGTRVMQFARAHEKKVVGEWVPVEIECIAMSDNRRRLFTAAEGVIKIWNFNTGSVLRYIDMSNCANIRSITMAKKQIYVTGWHKAINVFSDFKGEEAVKKTWSSNHNSDCLCLCIMEPNMIASCSYDGAVIVWSRESTDAYCTLNSTFGPKPELATSVRSGGNKQNIMHVAADLEAAEENDPDEGPDAFMTIGLNLKKESPWYRGLRALKKRQIEREKRRAAKERKDFTARYKKKKTKWNMQGLSLIYESAVESLVFLGNRRPIDPHTATLVAGGAECWIRFWSIHPRGGLLAQFNASRRKLESVRCMTTDKDNEFLFTGDTFGLLRIFDIREFCNADRLTHEEREARERRLRQDFVYTTLPFKAEQMLDTMEKLREKKISVPDSSKPRNNLKAPRLLSSIRAHTMAITALEYIEERSAILTSSHDLTVRLWTKNCTYIGTFGETWKPIPKMVGRTTETPPRIPRDVLRVASAHTLGTLHNGDMPYWRHACYLVRRRIRELKKEKQIEEAREKMKEERRKRGEPDSDDEVTASGEKPVSKILGKFYKPKKWYLGPITTKDQGLNSLRLFRGKCSPYHSTLPRELTCMAPLYTPPTFLDIDSRRPNHHKTRRTTRNMMNIFNRICCYREDNISQTISFASQMTIGTNAHHMSHIKTISKDISGGSEHVTGENKTDNHPAIIGDKSDNKPDEDDDNDKGLINDNRIYHYHDSCNPEAVGKDWTTTTTAAGVVVTTNVGREMVGLESENCHHGRNKKLGIKKDNEDTAGSRCGNIGKKQYYDRIDDFSVKAIKDCDTASIGHNGCSAKGNDGKGDSPCGTTGDKKIFHSGMKKKVGGRDRHKKSDAVKKKESSNCSSTDSKNDELAVVEQLKHLMEQELQQPQKQHHQQPPTAAKRFPRETSRSRSSPMTREGSCQHIFTPLHPGAKKPSVVKKYYTDPSKKTSTPNAVMNTSFDKSSVCSGVVGADEKGNVTKNRKSCVSIKGKMASSSKATGNERAREKANRCRCRSSVTGSSIGAESTLTVNSRKYESMMYRDNDNDINLPSLQDRRDNALKKGNEYCRRFKSVGVKVADKWRRLSHCDGDVGVGKSDTDTSESVLDAGCERVNVFGCLPPIEPTADEIEAGWHTLCNLSPSEYFGYKKYDSSCSDDGDDRYHEYDCDNNRTKAGNEYYYTTFDEMKYGKACRVGGGYDDNNDEYGYDDANYRGDDDDGGNDSDNEFVRRIRLETKKYANFPPCKNKTALKLPGSPSAKNTVRFSHLLK